MAGNADYPSGRGLYARPGRPLVIAHRGASAYLPEHTLAAYALAALQGADFLEPDLVMTADGALIARHDNRLDLSTDVAQRPEFTARRTTREVDGVRHSGWLSEDFTLAEIRTLRAVERIPALRPANARHDGLYGVPTLGEILALVRALEGVTGRRLGLYPEAKHPSHFAARGLDPIPVLIAQLHGAGYRRREDPVYLQCFEPAALRRARAMTELALVQLLDASGAPADGGREFAALARPAGLREIAGYASAVGPAKALVLGEWPAHAGAPPDTGFVAAAHRAGLAVHVWTLRPENAFLPPALRWDTDPAAWGNHVAELRTLLALGVDGVFADAPGLVLAALAEA